MGLLLREGGWIVIGGRPCELETAIELLKGWGLTFGTLAFRKHDPYRKGRNIWVRPKIHILQEDLQEVLVIGFKPPFSNKGLSRFATKGRKWMTNFPTRWEYNEYWKLSTLWGYPRLEIWARPYQGRYDPKRWTRIGPLMDGLPISQSLWLEHAKRFPTPLAIP